ncbi:MAG: threonine-phosphate decarboxylase CobD [Kiloniellales bacterium]
MPLPARSTEETPEMVVHGGDTQWAERLFGRPPDGWLDLSTGINPFPYPVDGLPADTWTRLPDSGADRALRQAAADYYGVGDPALVVAAPGSQALIQWLPRLRPRSRVAVLGPTYGEHARAWANAGHAVDTVADPDEPGPGVDVLVVTNPNNPDGRCYPPGHLMAIADRLARRGGLLVVDEAFADLDPGASVAPSAGAPGLMVLRSFGKFFGLAGLRLGFGLAAPAPITELRDALGPWAVSGPAAHIATRAFRDGAWIAATRIKLAEGAARLDALLEDAGLAVAGGTALYRLVTGVDAPDLFVRLGRRGILVRHFPEQPEWLRFGLPGDDRGYARLAEALAARPKKRRRP